jgi:hypothetical protein
MTRALSEFRPIAEQYLHGNRNKLSLTLTRMFSTGRARSSEVRALLERVCQELNFLPAVQNNFLPAVQSQTKLIDDVMAEISRGGSVDAADIRKIFDFSWG